MLDGCVEDDTILVQRPCAIDNMCHEREGYLEEFFYKYATLFTELHACLPFNRLTITILHILNVCPTQLHRYS